MSERIAISLLLAVIVTVIGLPMLLPAVHWPSVEFLGFNWSVGSVAVAILMITAGAVAWVVFGEYRQQSMRVKMMQNKLRRLRRSIVRYEYQINLRRSDIYSDTVLLGRPLHPQKPESVISAA